MGVIVGLGKGKEQRERAAVWREKIRKENEDNRKKKEIAHLINSLYKSKLLDLREDNPAEYILSLLNSDLESRILPEVLFEDYEYSMENKASLHNRVLIIDSDLPSKDEIGVKGYFKNGNPKAWSKTELPQVFEDILYSICLQSINSCITADIDNTFDAILYNGHVCGYSPINGQWKDSLILSLYVTKEQFSGIDVEHVDPKACFKALKGVSSAKLIDLTPIQPVMTFNKEDNRFIESHNVDTNSGTNIASMDWQEFEHLVRQVLELEFGKNGGEVKVTQASRDGGVDAVIFDPDPLRGGKIVVQAKRYTNTVSVESVRALATVVRQENAIKGIMITTSDYGTDSYDLCKENPILLLNGAHLLSLLQKNGLEGYINIAEAKKNLKEVE